METFYLLTGLALVVAFSALTVVLFMKVYRRD